MSVDYLPQPNNTYAEDVSTVLAGTSLVSRPCQVWQIAVAADTSGTFILNFSDTSAAYATASRVFKMVVAGPDTEIVSFPHGLNCTKGLCVTSNLAGADVFVSYD